MTRGAVREKGEGDVKGETEDAPFCNTTTARQEVKADFPGWTVMQSLLQAC